MIFAKSDGLCHPNPSGICTWAFIVRDSECEIGTQKSGLVGKGKGMNSVLGEFTGMLKLLEELNKMEIKDKKISIMTDYMLVSKQINGEWKVNSRVSSEFLPKIQDILCNIRKHNEVTVKWIPREENKEADKLTIREYNIWKQVE